MEHNIQFNYQARYFTHGNPGAPNLIIALHGYAQLASYFVRKFESLDADEYYVVAPEGLHRFYQQGTEGRVVASWMTKEDRETDISNYLAYLNALIGAVGQQRIYKKSILLGFSQGGATACRFLGSTLYTFDSFILWAAVFPPDMKPASLESMQKTKNFLVAGKSDTYYPEEVLVNELKSYAQSGIKFDLRQFDGGHSIELDTLKKILHEI